VEVVPEDLPLDDKATYEIFAKGFTSGVFSSNRAACATFCGATTRAASKT